MNDLYDLASSDRHLDHVQQGTFAIFATGLPTDLAAEAAAAAEAGLPMENISGSALHCLAVDNAMECHMMSKPVKKDLLE